MTHPVILMQQFRSEVYNSFTQRADVGMDLVDAIAAGGVVESPVVVSLSPQFRRQYSSVYDGLEHIRIDEGRLSAIYYKYSHDRGLEWGGYEIYAVDPTFHSRREAECLPDRIRQRPRKNAPADTGHVFSHLARLMDDHSSWCATISARRVSTATTANAVAGEQVKDLDSQSEKDKIVVGDTQFCAEPFLEAVAQTKTVSAVVRVRSSSVLYAQPPPRPAGKRGAPQVHGERLKLSEPQREPEERQELELDGERVEISCWRGYHFKKLARLPGVLVRVVVYKKDGKAKYPRPLWLFWLGKMDESATLIYRCYSRRFTIEHYFRFLKGHLGLARTRVRRLESEECWVRLCVLGYWQLVMGRMLGLCELRPWERKGKEATPRQVVAAMGKILARVGTPAQPPRSAGKGLGRQQGYHPAPAKRYGVVSKAKKAQKKAKKAA